MSINKKVTYRILLEPKDPIPKLITFPIDMTWKRLIPLKVVGRETTKKQFLVKVWLGLPVARGVPATADRAGAPWLQQHSVGNYFVESPWL